MWSRIKESVPTGIGWSLGAERWRQHTNVVLHPSAVSCTLFLPATGSVERSVLDTQRECATGRASLHRWIDSISTGDARIVLGGGSTWNLFFFRIDCFVVLDNLLQTPLVESL